MVILETFCDEFDDEGTPTFQFTIMANAEPGLISIETYAKAADINRLWLPDVDNVSLESHVYAVVKQVICDTEARDGDQAIG